MIRHCHFTGKEGYSATSGLQLKGGTSGVTVEYCRFQNAGQRPINAGGSTGLPYFRPLGVKYEARQLIIRHNEIEGSMCGIAFVGVDGATFEHNRVSNPTHWLIRILQETKEPGFIPCRNVVIQDNHFQFLRSQIRSDVNLGEGAEPASFRFMRNHWHATDQPAASRPRLPVEEQDGRYGGG